MVVCEFSVVPLGVGESISAQVARCVKIVRESGLPHQLTPMGTILEGEWDQVFSVIKRCRDELRRDFNRVLITIRVDTGRHRRGGLRPRSARWRRNWSVCDRHYRQTKAHWLYFSGGYHPLIRCTTGLGDRSPHGRPNLFTSADDLKQ